MKGAGSGVGGVMSAALCPPRLSRQSFPIHFFWSHRATMPHLLGTVFLLLLLGELCMSGPLPWYYRDYYKPLPSYQEYKEAMGKVNGELPSSDEYLQLFLRNNRITLPPNVSFTFTTPSPTTHRISERTIRSAISVYPVNDTGSPTTTTGMPIPVKLGAVAGSLMDNDNGIPSVQIPSICREGSSSTGTFWTDLYCAVFLLSWLIFMSALAVYTILRSIRSFQGNAWGQAPPAFHLHGPDPEGIPLRRLGHSPAIPTTDEFTPNTENPLQLRRDPRTLRGLFRLGSNPAPGQEEQPPIPALDGDQH